MKDAQDWNEAYLLELIAVGEQESLTLDYKASAALAKDSSKRNDLSKDVSAFANSAGGFLVYGMLEDKHVPTGIDVGLDRTVITKEWLESVVKSVIQPAVDGVIIKAVEVPSKGVNKVVYVLQILQATSRAPHQASDYRYYKRYNFESAPMEDYEVRDLMRRSIEYGRKYGAAWDLNGEMNRLTAAINERNRLESGQNLPRDNLKLPISPALRSAGNAIVLLSKPLRHDVAEMVKRVDEFNSAIEISDPGQGARARLNQQRKNDLADISALASGISTALKKILDDEP